MRSAILNVNGHVILIVIIIIDRIHIHLKKNYYAHQIVTLMTAEIHVSNNPLTIIRYIEKIEHVIEHQFHIVHLVANMIQIINYANVRNQNQIIHINLYLNQSSI